MQNKVSAQDIKEQSYPLEKAESDYLNFHWVYIVARPISFYFTPFFINRGMSANQVTFLSLIPFILSLLSFLYGGIESIGFVIGAIFINVWHLFDLIDGNIARYTKTKSGIGGLLDAMIGGWVRVFIPLSMGIGLYMSSPAYGVLISYFDISPTFFLYMGVIWGIAVLLRQNISLLWLVKLGSEEEAESEVSHVNILGRRLLSYDLPLLLIFSLIGWADFWFVFYGIFNIATPFGISLLKFYMLLGEEK